MKDNDNEITLDDLAWIAEDSRRKRYAGTLLLKLCESPGETVTLRKSEPLPKLVGIDPVDTPTFRELADYIQGAYKVNPPGSKNEGAAEIIVGSKKPHPHRGFLLHLTFHEDAADPSITISMERNPEADIPNKSTGDSPREEPHTKRQPSLNPDTVLSPISIDEFKERAQKSRLSCLGVVFLLSLLLAVFITLGAGMYVGRWVAVVCVIAFVGLLVHLVCLAKKIARQHGLCCPYCGGSLLSDWGNYHSIKRRRVPKVFEDSFKKRNCFHTGLCHHCKVEVIDLEV